MKRIYIVVLIIFNAGIVIAQSQSGCTITFPNNFDAQVDFSSIYDPAQCPSGDVILSNLNDKNGNSTVTFDASTTLNSLTLNYKSGNNPLEIIIPSGITLTVTNDLIMNLTSVVQDKFLTVDGDLIVGGTLDFGDIDLEIDGTGSIDASTITGDGATTCSSSGGGTGTCPTITADTCDPSSGGLCAESGTVMPVELIFFTGVEAENGVLLNWATASEENFDYFQVERAAEGTNFEPLGEINGAGESYTRLDYSFEDEFPELGFNYYRLKSVDLDGTFEYSNVTLVRFTSNIQFEISPNPTSGNISLRTSLPTTGGLRYEITNQFGTIVKDGTLSRFNTEIDLGGQTKGVYIVRLIDVPNAKVQRIILN